MKTSTAFWMWWFIGVATGIFAQSVPVWVLAVLVVVSGIGMAVHAHKRGEE